MSPEEVVLILGEPLRKKINRSGEPDWSYEKQVVRFSKSDGGVVEIGFTKTARVFLHRIDIFQDPKALDQLLGRDSEVFEYYGFLVFLGLGIATGGLHDGDESQKAITAFEKGRWDQFRGDTAFRRWQPRGLAK